MYQNNQRNSWSYNFGCSTVSLLLGLTLLLLVIRGGFIFILNYFWMIVALGIVVWIFRKVIQVEQKTINPKRTSKQTQYNWSRDFENKEKTSFDNFDRDFEEIDDE